MNPNNMICDVETGICGEPGDEEFEMIDLTKPKKTIDLYYVTDPICSHCWALEPVLRRFTLQYGHYFNFHTVMGGLLEKWGGGPVDPANGISGPQDVAGHWREVGEATRMPIDGSLWYDNPVQSSFTPSRVFKVIQQKSPELANIFLRRAREAVFVFNENISDASVLTRIVKELGLNGEAIVKESEQSTGHKRLNEDFSLAQSLGVRGFPTIIMVNEEKKGIKIVGARTLEYYIAGLKQVLQSEKEPQPTEVPSLSDLLRNEKLLFSKEIEVMYDVEKADIPTFIENELTNNNYEMKEILGENYIVNK